MNKTLTYVTAIFLFGMAFHSAPTSAEGSRSNTIKAAKAQLEELEPIIEKRESGDRSCDLGIVSSWHRTNVTRVSDHGAKYGLLPGDKLIALNGQDITINNYHSLRSKLKANDDFSLRIARNATYQDLDGNCADGTDKDDVGISMLKAAAGQGWTKCIEKTYEIDRLMGRKTAFAAYWRNECSEAKRCSDRRCKKPTQNTASLFYDYQRLGFEELSTIGMLDEWRSEYLSAISWLEDAGYRRFARELEADWQKANSTSTPKSAAPAPAVASKTAYGTCFAVSPTEVLTSHHVVAGATVITVSFPGTTETGAIVTQQSQSTDLAVLKINGKAPAALPLAPMRSLVVGDEIFTIGFPVTEILGAEPKFTEGSVSSLSGLKDDASYFQMSVPVQPGNSGGPVVNMQGEVVGIVASTAAIETFYASSGSLPQNINWAAKSDYARLMFDPPTLEIRAKDRTDAIAMANAAICRVKAVSN